LRQPNTDLFLRARLDSANQPERIGEIRASAQALDCCLDAFSSREPVPASLESALAAVPPRHLSLSRADTKRVERRHANKNKLEGVTT
jgi:hypothetical protein